MTGIDRRTFLGAAGTVALTASRAWALAPSERVRLAVIGLKSRGTELVQEFGKNPGVEVVAVCDIDDANFRTPVKSVEKLGGKAPRIEKDFRRLLDDKSIDAVAVATPDHWHALI